jgi:hypothetical protein
VCEMVIANFVFGRPSAGGVSLLFYFRPTCSFITPPSWSVGVRTGRFIPVPGTGTYKHIQERKDRGSEVRLLDDPIALSEISVASARTTVYNSYWC